KNHGVLVTGDTVAQAYRRLYKLERVCRAQILAMSSGQPLEVLSDEIVAQVQWPLAVAYATAALFFLFDQQLLGGLDRTAWLVAMFAWLFGVIMLSAFAVVRHSDCLAEILGEPYGTLILTFAITAIEVLMIAAVMLAGPEVSTLARDTMLAVGVIVFNGMVGLTLLIGG